MQLNTVDTVIEIVTMSLTAACLAVVAVSLWVEQKEIRRKELVEMIERRINGN